MDYEQKYKEALGWMQSLYKGLHGATKEDAEHYFPELKESEDEKIRKMLRAYIHDFGVSKEYFGDVETSDVLAWLEKQKESEDKGEISTSVNIRKKKTTGVLGEMIANINPESLQKTKEQMIAEVEQQIKRCIGMILTDVNERRFEDFGVTLKECLEWLEKARQETRCRRGD